jgi:hypothetical protein
MPMPRGACDHFGRRNQRGALQPAVPERSASATHGHAGDKVTARAVFKKNRKGERLIANCGRFEGVALQEIRNRRRLDSHPRLRRSEL